MMPTSALPITERVTANDVDGTKNLKREARASLLTPLARLSPMVAGIWFGMLVGVSFIATPIKFQAAGLDLPVALDIGRLTFGMFARVEWGLAIVFISTLLASEASDWRRYLAGGVIAGLALQGMWLLPALDARVAAIIAGEMPEGSSHHIVYAGIEGFKAIALFALSFPARQEPGRGPFDA